MLKWINKKRNKKGFTLIELVVVIAILGVLGAIAVPRLGGFRTNATEAADKATAATIAKAAELKYATDGSSKISLDDLSGLIDGDLKPQKAGETVFVLKFDIGTEDVPGDNMFKVYYGSDTEFTNPLYPENIEEPTTP